MAVDSWLTAWLVGLGFVFTLYIYITEKNKFGPSMFRS